MTFTIIISATDDDCDNFIAEMHGADVYASGDTPIEALRNIEDIIRGRYAFLLITPDCKLGPIPKRQKSVLSQFFGEKHP